MTTIIHILEAPSKIARFHRTLLNFNSNLNAINYDINYVIFADNSYYF